MTITNALASVAVRDINVAAPWYEKILGQSADAIPTAAMAEWKFPSGGWLQVYALPERAGSCSCTLVVTSIEEEASRVEKLGVATGARMGEQANVFMIKDPDGNSIAFAQTPDKADGNASKHDSVAIARAAYDAYVSKDRAAIEALIADDFHFSSPLDNQLDRAAYFARCWPNSKTIQSFDFIYLVRDGARVFVTYEAIGARGHRFRNTEIVTVRASQIIEIEVYFGWDLPHQAAVGGSVAEA